MKSSIKIFIGLVFVLIVSCAKNPFTGKSTMAFVPNSQIFPSSFQQYNQFLSENKVIKGTADAKRITTIGMKIKTAAERYLSANGNVGYLDGYEWEYNLVESKELNAWCMPGGKIVFYTGILPICKDDAGIAAVMGHEVAHALANHGQQRMSAGLLQQLGAVGTQIAIGNKSPETQAMIMQAYGVGSNIGGMLPFSRSHESEADMIGLTLMAIAGYNPENAVALWERMSALGGQAPPEILSTHPSNATRIKELTALVPGAKKEAAKFGVTFK
ncbi:M48 family metallopeptidase [Flavobacterium haoranii]|uniref:Peptidase family M48 n=1 Tax=Flavobacterium haoranii TaxID=683124 RepID=A0A1M6MAG1_9FLAO|nr:M48 family metallopeptidase [Flavobacterium haoranii]SHJ80478.1 Peptidase family M48 [Flavobacterium haoranii]